MFNKIKTIVFTGMVVSLSLFSLQVNAYNKRASDTCKDGSCRGEKYERKELTPEEKECLDDARSFVFSYEIVRGMHDMYAKELGSVPVQVQADLAEADAAWNEFRKLETNSLIVPYLVDTVLFWIAFYKSPLWALEYCKEMYAQEMNDRFGSHFSPTSNDPFLKSNYVCHTSYGDALQNIRRLLNKYRAGHRCH
ncbi:hypothetical protein AYO37_01110 [Opitutia bacterium SCGC AG-212-L18]|nr:hypothetical protein AYO37_01110 [Opitutae bacterium SCGC AG-212-L18]